MKKKWKVLLAGGNTIITADTWEVTGTGELAFYADGAATAAFASGCWFSIVPEPEDEA